MSSRITAVVVGLALLVAAAPAGHAAEGGSGGETIEVAVPGAVTCTAGDGTALGADPALRPGDRIVCAVSGLGPSEMADVTLDPGGADLGTISMNAQGGATFDLTVPSDAATGTHTLTFTGETTKGVATFGFTVEPGSGNGNGSGSGGGSGGGGLAFTGADVLGPLTGALVLIGGGTLLTSYRRRRRHG